MQVSGGLGSVPIQSMSLVDVECCLETFYVEDSAVIIGRLQNILQGTEWACNKNLIQSQMLLPKAINTHVPEV